MNKQKTITILGAGYVGLTTAAILSVCGYKVYAVEPNQQRLSSIKNGKSFFFEKGLDNVISEGIRRATLIPTDSYKESVTNSSIVISCVGTPDKQDGSSNLDYVFSAANDAAKYLSENSIYVQKSTVPVGTGTKIEEIFLKLKKNIYYVSNPEFLRESTALQDTLYFDRVVAGGNNYDSVLRILDMYRSVQEQREKIMKLSGITNNLDDKPLLIDGKYISTNLNSAELIKVTSNAFLALKISFANSIAILTDQVKADINDVMAAVGADPRIGSSFLRAGRGYGGGCFPKDVSGLIMSAQDHDVDLKIMKAAKEVNDGMPAYIVSKITKKIKAGASVSVLGLAFKSGTSDVRRSPGIKIANLLNELGYSVKTYDPEANEEARTSLNHNILVCNSIDDTLNGSEVVVIATEWPVFLSINLDNTKKIMQGNIFVDAINSFDPIELKKHEFDYIGVGR